MKEVNPKEITPSKSSEVEKIKARFRSQLKRDMKQAAIDDFRDNMEKMAIAGIPGFMIGVPIGGLGGGTIGRGIANIAYPITDEVRDIKQQTELYKQKIKAINNQINQSVKVSPCFDDNVFDELLDELKKPEYDNLNVSEIEDIVNQRYQNMQKTASFKKNFKQMFYNDNVKHVLHEAGQIAKDVTKKENKRFLRGAAIGTAITTPIGIRAGFVDKKDNNASVPRAKNNLNFYRDYYINRQKDLDRINNSDDFKKAVAVEGMGDTNTIKYTPAFLAGYKNNNDCLGTGELVDDILDENGINIGTLPWGVYKSLLNSTNDLYWNPDREESNDYFDDNGEIIDKQQYFNDLMRDKIYPTKEAKINAFKDNIEKLAIAGIPGFVVGSALGAAGGVAIGKGTANIKHPMTNDIKKIYQEAEPYKHDMLELRRQKEKIEDNLPKFSNEEFKAMQDEFDKPEYNNLTVGEIENIVNQRFQNLQKTASFKNNARYILREVGDVAKEVSKKEGKRFLIGAGTGAALGSGIGGAISYKNNVNENTSLPLAKNTLNSYRDNVISLKNEIPNIEKNWSFKDAIAGQDHNDLYSPSLLSKPSLSVACEGESFYGDNLNALLAQNGIDYRDIPWKDYKNMLLDTQPDFSNGIIEGEDGFNELYDDKIYPILNKEAKINAFKNDIEKSIFIVQGKNL